MMNPAAIWKTPFLDPEMSKYWSGHGSGGYLIQIYQ